MQLIANLILFGLIVYLFLRVFSLFDSLEKIAKEFEKLNDILREIQSKNGWL